MLCCCRSISVIVILEFISLVFAGTDSVIEVPLEKINDNYYGYIAVGEPPRKFLVNFDTGSQHLWLVTTETCPEQDCINVMPEPYGKDMSATYKEIKTDEPFQLEYTDGTCITGNLGRDYVQLGEGAEKIKILQTIGLANSVQGNFHDCHGIFGLGLLSGSLFPRITGSTSPPDPPMWTMYNKYGIEEFGIYLARVPQGKQAGKLIFVKPDGNDENYEYHKPLIEGPLQKHDVEVVDDPERGSVFDGYKIKLDKLIVQKGENRIEVDIGEDMLVLPDSGNTVIAGPEDLIRKVNTLIYKDAKFQYTRTKFMFFCDKDITQLANVIFVIDGHEYPLTPQEFMRKTGVDSTACQSGLVGVEGHKHIVLGQLFMQTYYTTFNIVQQTVGIARARHEH